MHLITSIVLFITVVDHSIQSSNYQIISITGEKIPLYTGLYYAITNRQSGHYWSTNFTTIHDLDINHSTHWHKLLNSTLNSYFMSNDNDYYNIEKIDDNYYRIIEKVMNGRPCSGQPIYEEERMYTIYCCVNCSNIYEYKYQWKFTEHPDYSLNAIMTDLQFEIPSQSVIEKHMKRVDLLEPTIISNDSPAKLTEEISNEIRKTQSFEISNSKSILHSAKYFNTFLAQISISGKILGIGSNILTEFSAELGRNSTVKTITNEVTYRIRKSVEVPQYEKVEVFAYVDWADRLPLPFNATVSVTGVGPRFENDGQLDSSAIKVLLSKYGFDEQLIDETEDQLTFQVSGTLTASFGVDSVYNLTSLGRTRLPDPL